MNRYDEIKRLLKASRGVSLNEEETITPQIAAGQERKNPKKKEEKIKKYIVNGALVQVFGSTSRDLELTDEEKESFVISMEEFIEDIGEMVEFKVLNVYQNNIEWQGTLLQEKVDFIFSLDDSMGLYITADLLQLRDDTLEVLQKLQMNYKKWVELWSKSLTLRKVGKRSMNNPDAKEL